MLKNIIEFKITQLKCFAPRHSTVGNIGSEFMDIGLDAHFNRERIVNRQLHSIAGTDVNKKVPIS